MLNLRDQERNGDIKEIMKEPLHYTIIKPHYEIKALTALVCQLSLSVHVGWENGPELKPKEIIQTLFRHPILQYLIWVCTFCQCPSPGFKSNLLYMALWCHKNSMAISNRYLDFVQTHGLISLVNDYHVDNKVREILVNVYYWSILTIEQKRRFDIIPYLPWLFGYISSLPYLS